MRHRLARRQFGLGMLAAVLPAALDGCGFQPVYMPTASGQPGPAQRELAAVYVGVIPDRPGQLLRQALQARFDDQAGTPPAYELNVGFSISGEGIAIEQSNIATRLRLIGTATYNLITRDGKRTQLYSGSARAFDSVNIFESQYFASDLELETKQQRIADECASQIAAQLATWFRSRARQTAER